ncbi:pyroglutamyl-peptidase 1 isoform X2 [Pseudorca crassidens]|uniref:pyroglutamyl-peptidase 1 isoform X2 n=1 Tax=Pseudorca crassidens TaxID=82174 RepID=UPI00352CD233
MEQPRKAVVVTGFGPFGEHTVNASWIAVQELEKLGLGDSVDLHVYEIPVEYKTVQRLIPALWEKHSPQLVVHVGVSGMATTVTLEKCGHNKGYKGLDNCRFCPGSQCCVEDGPESIDSIIDMDAVCKRVTTLGLDVSVTISQDAGSVWMEQTQGHPLLQPLTTLQHFFPVTAFRISHSVILGHRDQPTPFFEINSLLPINRELPDSSELFH